MTDDYTNPEIARTLVRIEAGQKDLADKFDKLTDRFVTTEVFDLRVAAVERDIKEGKAKVEVAQATADSRRPSGLTVAVAVAAIVATVVNLIPFLIK